MGCKTIAEQLAAALGKEDVNTSDQLPIVENDTLYRVTVGDLALSLGLTGSLNSVGGALGVPVLTGTAPDYEVRKLRGGNGITTQLNTDGGITVSTNLANAGNAAAGERLIPNTSTNPIAFKRIKAGAGISLTASANSITVNNTLATGGANTQIVAVSTLADLPTAASGVITLADNTVYDFVADLSTSNRFVMGANTVVRSADPYAVTLEYTGTGVMFTTTDGNQSIHEIGLSCPNGTLVDTTGNTTGNLLMRWLRIDELKDFGTVEKPVSGLYDILIITLTGSGGLDYGVQTNARTNVTDITVLNATNAALTMVDLNAATFDALLITGFQILSSVSGQTFLSGAASGGNITGENIGFVNNVVVEGDMVGLDTISNGDAGWDFTDNNLIADTRPVALLTLSTPATTTITAAATPVIINGTFTSQAESIFSIAANGVVTYNGRRPKSTDVTASITFTSASGTNTYTFFVALNGVPITASGVSREVSSTTTANISLVWDLEVATGDTIAIWVQNDGSTTDCDAVTVTTRIK